jgi:putative flippase GtrA
VNNRRSKAVSRYRLGHSATRELLYTARFAVVGAAATMLHLAVVWLLIKHTVLPPLSANFLAFISAFGVSFTGNYYWTFRRPGSPTVAIQRFFLVSISAFALNTLALVELIATNLLTPSTAAVLAAFVIPAVTFLSSRLWAFKAP